MVTKIYSSTDCSRLGIQVVEISSEYNTQSLKRLKIFRVNGRWSYSYLPSDDYARKKLLMGLSTPKWMIYESMLSRIYRKRKEIKDLNQRCEVLILKIFNERR